MDGTKWALALVLACPTCAGSFFLALSGAAGIGSVLFKSVLLAAATVTLFGLWAWNWYRRRGECTVPVGGQDPA